MVLDRNMDERGGTQERLFTLSVVNSVLATHFKQSEAMDIASNCAKYIIGGRHLLISDQMFFLYEPALLKMNIQITVYCSNDSAQCLWDKWLVKMETLLLSN